MIKADHSGPSYNFSGVVSPEFKASFIKWVRSQEWTREGSDDFNMTKDNSSKIHYTCGEDTSVTVYEEKDKTGIIMNGDCQEAAPPPSSLFEEATYSDGDGEAFAVYQGKTYDLEELLDFVKKIKTKKKMPRHP